MESLKILAIECTNRDLLMILEKRSFANFEVRAGVWHVFELAHALAIEKVEEIFFSRKRRLSKLDEFDFLKRGFAAYLMVTVTLWIACWSIESNGMASPRNPAWELISGMRTVFDWIGIVVASVPSLFWINIRVHDRRSASQNAVYEHEAQMRRVVDFEESRVRRENERHAEELRLACEKKEQAERDRRNAQERLIQKQRRSADEANKSALNDF